MIHHYLVTPSVRGDSQRITLPAKLLKQKGWLKTRLYLLANLDEAYITLKPYGVDVPEETPTSWKRHKRNK